jgi:cytochrome c oxidase subunit 2
MQIKVIVETQEEYDAWLKEQETFKTLVSAN